MAEDNEELPWSEEANTVIEDLSQDIDDKYGIKLKDLLMNPAFYVSKSGIDVTFSNIREEVEGYINNMLEQLGDEKKEMEKDGLKCDAVTKQLSQNISMQAKQNNIPIVKPSDMDRNTDFEETIYINNVDNGTIALVAKLAGSASFIVDLSTTYKTYNLGKWLFDGQKNYVVNVAMEPNVYMDFDNVKEEIKALMDGVENTLKSGNANAKSESS